MYELISVFKHNYCIILHFNEKGSRVFNAFKNIFFVERKFVDREDALTS